MMTKSNLSFARHYFVLVDRGCYADLHSEKEGFFYIKSNPDSEWRDNP
jgi:hypothetical protein